MTAIALLPMMSRSDADSAAPPSDSIKRGALAGWLVIGIFFGFFGGWSVIAPLNGAVVANGVVKVQGNRKSIQHLDGGIIKELRIKEGDTVAKGDVLVILDETQARAEFEVLTQQYAVLRSAEVRLLAEIAGTNELLMPSEFESRQADPYFKDIWMYQVKQFETRKAALEGQRNVIREKINQLSFQIEGTGAQISSWKDQVKSVKSEADTIRPLVEQGLIQRPRLLQLDRTAYGLEGQVADGQSSISKYKQAIAEQQLQISQLDNERMTDVAKELRELQAKLLEVIPKAVNAKAILGRMVIKSPYAGRVVGLNVFSVGGVIQRGEKILDIVPEEESLTIEAQIAVEDISDVHQGAKAEVHLTAYKQRVIPVIHGDVIQVSADRLTDQKTNAPYYTALIQLDAEELAQLPSVRLYPGMPAQVMIPTTERTAFDYVVGPITMSFNRAFKQK